MFLTEKYPECFVEYRPIIVKGFVLGIEVIGEGRVNSVLSEIEKRVDIKRARKAGCKTMKQVCEFLNG